MPPLGALSQAWVSANASLPLGWELVGLWRFGGSWVSLAEGPNEDYASGSGPFEYVALQRLADQLRERRGPTTG